MTLEQPRLRMFAGPNGSGKTTIKNGLRKSDDWFGIYINPDELEKAAKETGAIPIESFELSINTAELHKFFANSTLLRKRDLCDPSVINEVRNGSISVRIADFNSYHASVLADFLRRKALDERRSFSFETVMSSRDKVDLLREAQSRGFRTYLYYVATEHPSINIERVHNRVADGGHDVPTAKILTRYHRSLRLLPIAVKYSNRAFFFDTSGDESWYFAEASNWDVLQLKSQEMPLWFRNVWRNFGQE